MLAGSRIAHGNLAVDHTASAVRGNDAGGLSMVGDVVAPAAIARTRGISNGTMNSERIYERVNGLHNSPSLSNRTINAVHKDGGSGSRVLTIQVNEVWDYIRSSWEVGDGAKGPGGIGCDAPGVAGVLECHGPVDGLAGELESAQVVGLDTDALDGVDSIGHGRHLGASISMISVRWVSGGRGSCTLEIWMEE